MLWLVSIFVIFAIASIVYSAWTYDSLDDYDPPRTEAESNISSLKLRIAEANYRINR